MKPWRPVEDHASRPYLYFDDGQFSPSYTPLPVDPDLIQVKRRGLSLFAPWLDDDQSGPSDWAKRWEWALLVAIAVAVIVILLSAWLFIPPLHNPHPTPGGAHWPQRY